VSDTIAIVSRLSPQTIKTIDGATIDVFAALAWTCHCSRVSNRGGETSMLADIDVFGEKHS